MKLRYVIRYGGGVASAETERCDKAKYLAGIPSSQTNMGKYLRYVNVDVTVLACRIFGIPETYLGWGNTTTTTTIKQL